MYVNYAVWESAAAFGAAFNRPEFKQTASQFPASVTAMPHRIRKIGVTVRHRRHMARKPRAGTSTTPKAAVHSGARTSSSTATARAKSLGDSIPTF